VFLFDDGIIRVSTESIGETKNESRVWNLKTGVCEFSNHNFPSQLPFSGSLRKFRELANDLEIEGIFAGIDLPVIDLPGKDIFFDGSAPSHILNFAHFQVFVLSDLVIICQKVGVRPSKNDDVDYYYHAGGCKGPRFITPILVRRECCSSF
jgi:hypothetical protein